MSSPGANGIAQSTALRPTSGTGAGVYEVGGIAGRAAERLVAQKEPGSNFYLSFTDRSITGMRKVILEEGGEPEFQSDQGHMNSQLGLYKWPTVGKYRAHSYPQGDHLLAVKSGSKSTPEVIQRLPEAIKAQIKEGSEVTFIWAVDDCSSLIQGAEGTVNLISHAWRFPNADKLSRLVPMGLFTTMAKGTSGVKRDTTTQAIAFQAMKAATVHIHDGGRGRLACSPNNAKFTLLRRDMSHFWTVTKHETQDKYVVTCQWILGNAESSTTEKVKAAANSSQNLGELFSQLSDPEIRQDAVAEMKGIFAVE